MTAKGWAIRTCVCPCYKSWGCNTLTKYLKLGRSSFNTALAMSLNGGFVFSYKQVALFEWAGGQKPTYFPLFALCFFCQSDTWLIISSSITTTSNVGGASTFTVCLFAPFSRGRNECEANCLNFPMVAQSSTLCMLTTIREL